MADEPPIPANHGIREIWEINQLDVEGLISRAKAGDHAAARVLMARYLYRKQLEQRDREAGVTRIATNRAQHPIERYIQDAITASLKADDANIGFNLTRPKCRPKATYREKLKFCRIGFRVAQLIEQYPTEKEAYRAAADEFHISIEKARHYHKKYAKAM